VRRKKSRYDSRLGKLFFVLPILLIVSVVVYAYVELNAPGTLVVQALDAHGAQLKVSVTVGSQTGNTPLRLSLSQGTYSVTYGSTQWYRTPLPKQAIISPGITSYANAIYSPVIRVIQLGPSGFNTTVVTALHAVTPVIWLNPSTSSIVINGGQFSHIVVEPGQNFTYTFPAAGNYQFFIYSTNMNMTVQVQ
jgi:hypothetical protein